MSIRTVRNGIAAIAALGFLAAGAVPAQAQGMTDDGSKWSVEGRAGIGVPVGDFSDLAVDGVAPTFGLGAGYAVHPRVTLRADGDVEMYGGTSFEDGLGGTGPDISLWHYNAGAEFEVTPPAGPWKVAANLGVGATTWDTDEFLSQEGVSEVSDTYFTANGGLRVGYDVARNANVFVGGQWYLQFSDAEALRPLPGVPWGFDTVNTVPIRAGVTLGF